LQQLRAKVVAQRVYWILPANNKDIQQMIQLIAQDYGDTVLPIPRLQKDGVHPSWAGYRQLARQAQ
jgi:lysophospholipase L1-like esterase